MRALVALVHLNNSGAVGLFSRLGSVTALAGCAAGATVLTRRVVDPRKVALEPTASKVGFKVSNAKPSKVRKVALEPTAHAHAYESNAGFKVM
jgi:hypothetical protein